MRGSQAEKQQNSIWEKIISKAIEMFAHKQMGRYGWTNLWHNVPLAESYWLHIILDFFVSKNCVEICYVSGSTECQFSTKEREEKICHIENFVGWELSLPLIFASVRKRRLTIFLYEKEGWVSKFYENSASFSYSDDDTKENLGKLSHHTGNICPRLRTKNSMVCNQDAMYFCSMVVVPFLILTKHVDWVSWPSCPSIRV